MNLQNLMPLRQRHCWRYFAVVGAIAVAYYGAAKLAVSSLGLGLEASPLWPPAGIALAGLLLEGRRVWPGVALGSFFWCQSQVSLVMAFALAFGITLQALVGAKVLSWVKFCPSLKRLQYVLQLVVWGAWGSPLVNASISTLVGCLGGTVEPQNWQENWWTLWVGDGMGILIVTPILLIGRHWMTKVRWAIALAQCRQKCRQILERKGKNLWLQKSFTISPKLSPCNTPSEGEEMPTPAEAVICFTLLFIVSWLVFGSKPAVEMPHYPLEYLPFPFVIWAAIRFTQRGAIMAILMVSIIAIWGAMQGVGPFVGKTDIKQAVLFLQGFMGVVSITGLVLAAAESERARAVDLLKEREASLANAQRLAQLGNWDFYEMCNESSLPEQKLRWSDELYRLFGFTPKAFEPSWETLFRVVHPADRDRVGQAIRGALRDNKPYSLDYRIVLPNGSERTVCEQSEIYKGGIRGTVQDITERQRTEAQLRAAAEHVSEAAERQRLLAEMAMRIRRSLHLDQILNTTVAEVREFLNADRVFIGQIDGISQELKGSQLANETPIAATTALRQVERSTFQSSNQQTFNQKTFNQKTFNLQPPTLQPSNLRPSTRLKGVVIAESVDPSYPSVRNMIVDDEETIQGWRSLFNQGHVVAVEDTRATPCSCQIAEQHTEYQVAAILAVPIWVGNELYGALVVNQCSQPRHWQSWEIDWLTSLATQVAIAIQQAELYQQITDLAVHLESQVDERTQELTAKMTELQELNQLKDVFLQAVSHDLRTSLLGMSMLLNNLYKSAADAVNLSRPLLERMLTSNERQLNLINSLLEDHFNEERQLELHCQPIQLEQLCQDLITDYSPMLAQNQATLIQKFPPNCPFINADPTQLRRVLENLLTNALKHNPPGRNLNLEVTLENQKICCTLQDNGVGMSQEQQNSLFKLYIRGLHTKHLTGIGLGLYQCRQIVNAHGGEIGVISELNAGSKFWFTLPAECNC
ncbi:MASE1 domain-containing protein [Allocoleopsis sp.]|uniref:sensor histidine kinase n=1 Tax=Allocoleopsis sp. TaxID=3088169 RepID=UPI002FD4B313